MKEGPETAKYEVSSSATIPMLSQEPCFTFARTLLKLIRNYGCRKPLYGCSGIIGGAVGGWMNDRLGRKISILGADIIFFLGAIVMAIAHAP
ncbi:hypothetical protein AHAS_Ahas05G0245800 [Arachis hypogaea]